MKNLVTNPVIAKMSLPALKRYRRRICADLAILTVGGKCDCGCGEMLYGRQGLYGIKPLCTFEKERLAILVPHVKLLNERLKELKGYSGK